MFLRKYTFIAIVIDILSTLYSIISSHTYGLSTHEFTFPLLDIEYESNGILYIWFTDKIWQYHKNITDLYLRAPSLAASFITLMFVYSIGTQIGSLSKHKHKYLDVISIFFLAVNSAFLAFSFHNRFYAVNMMFISMSTYVLIKLSRNNSNILFVLYTFLMMCTTGTMILSSISIIPHIIFYIYASVHKRKAIIQSTIALATISMICCILYLLDQQAYNRFHYMDYDASSAYLFIVAGYLNLENSLISSNINSYNIHLLSTAIICIATITAIKKAYEFYKEKTICPYSLLGVQTIIIATTIYTFYSICVKNIAISANFSWLLPYCSIVMAQIATKRIFRIIILLLIFVAVPDTHRSLLLNGTSNKHIISVMNHYRKNDEPLYIMARNRESISHYLEDKKLKLEIDNDIRDDYYSNYLELRSKSKHIKYLNPSDITSTLDLLAEDYHRDDEIIWILINEHNQDDRKDVKDILNWLKQRPKNSIKYMTKHIEGLLVMIYFPANTVIDRKRRSLEPQL